VDTLKSWYVSCDISYFGELLLPGIKDFNSAKNHPSALEQAYRLGQELAS
jgi:hypothetical protein